MQLQLYGKKIWLYRQAVDFRCSIDGLSHIVTSSIKQPVKDGVFLFINRKRDKLKCLSWHKNGFIMLYKRLEKGLFSRQQQDMSVVELTIEEMSWLLAGLEWPKMRDWHELNYDKFS
jgi:transposase